MGNEPQTVQRAQDGDVTAMRELYERHAGRVYAVLRRLAGDDDLAQDLAQEAWVTTFKKLGSFEGRSSFGTWLHRVAVNTALGRLRSRAREPVVELIRDEWYEAPGAGAEDGVDRIALARAIDRLPNGYRVVLILHDVEGYTHEEIAQRLQIAPGTSKSQLHKARARMRELLTEGLRKVKENDVASH